MKSPDYLSEKEWSQIRQKRQVRMDLATRSFYWFFHLYFSHYIKYETADFQKEMMTLASDPKVEQLVIIAFRESGKSTLMTTALPLWAVTGQLQKKYVVIFSQTQNQAQQHLSNISRELESNDLMHKDFWPYDYETNELGVSAINLPKYGARIIAVSREQGVRGLRYGQHRPDLIIADDVEDSRTVKVKESRNSNFAWFTGELLPLGSEDTKYVVVGNLLHEDSLLMRLRDGILNGERSGVYKEYPIEQDGKTLWPSRFPNQEALKKLEGKIADPIRFEREYRLHLVPDDEQIITRPMIHTYSSLLPPMRGEHKFVAIGVDPAISEKDTSDCTAMVTLDIRGSGVNTRFYVQPQPINAHLGFPETMDLIKELNVAMRGPAFYVESVAYQQAIAQSALREVIDARPINLQMDKHTRLNMISSHIRDGIILFPETGFEAGISQLTGFGIERYDDIVDALTIAVIGYLREVAEDEENYIRVIGRVIHPNTLS